MTGSPSVSVIVPAFNAAHTIAACVRSLVALDFDREQCEVLVVDNGSTDGTETIAASFPVRVLAEPTRGSYAARNRGAQHARGEILAFTDTDCVADRSWLTNLAAGFNESDVGCVAGEVLSPPSATPVEEYARRRNLMSQSNTMRHHYLPYPITANCAYRADVFRRLGGFRDDMHSGGDADLAWRMQKELSLKIVLIHDAIVMHYHRSSLGELMRQSSRYARGAMDLTRRHGLTRPPLARRVAGVAVSAGRALKDVPLRIVQNGRGDPAAWMEPLCDLAWRMGEVAGMLGWYRSQMASRIRP
jgi:cellulose synthase/poly-beta-1,6-N-acetylglucosamine synthase-like glycosyltransferase